MLENIQDNKGCLKVFINPLVKYLTGETLSSAEKENTV